MSVTATADRRTSWTPLLPRPEVATSIAAVRHDLAARELLRNAPEVFETGVFAGQMPNFHWHMLFLPTEVEIIQQCADYKNFDSFFSFMILVYTDMKEEKVLMRSIRLWNQIMENKGE
jgi:hypothetical protein